MRELLLLSNSTAPGNEGFWSTLARPSRRCWVTAAACCSCRCQQRPGRLHRCHAPDTGPAGLEVTGVHQARDLTAAVADAQAVFGGGGNSFRLLRTLTTLGVLEPLRQAAQAGVPYLAASAGGNLACPTIRTTNDMPIVEPGSLAALGLIPFQLNPHYLDPDPRSPHRGETRPARIEEFLAENDVPVLGLREGAWLQVSGTRAHLSGRNTGRLFRRPTGPSTSRPARTCPTCSTPAPASTSAPQPSRRPGASPARAGARAGQRL